MRTSAGGASQRPSVSALRYSPVPPTMRTRLPRSRIWLMIGAAILRYSPTLKERVVSMQSMRWCWICARWAWVGDWVRMGMERYTCIESQETISAPRITDNSTAMADFPTAVGPTNAMTRDMLLRPPQIRFVLTPGSSALARSGRSTLPGSPRLPLVLMGGQARSLHGSLESDRTIVAQTGPSLQLKFLPRGLPSRCVSRGLLPVAEPKGRGCALL